MIAFLTNFLGQFIQPLSIVIILVFFGLLKIHKNPKGATWLIVIAFVLVALLGNTFFSSFLTRSMEWRYMPPAAETKADAIILMAGGAVAANTPRQMVEVNEEGDRVLAAAKLYKEGKAPLVIITGGTSPSNQSRNLLMSLGVPEKDIIMQDKSENITQDAVLTTQLMTDMSIKTAFLVTSAAQMDRAVLSFNEEKFDVIPAPVDYRVTEAYYKQLMRFDVRQTLFNLMPTSQAFSQSSAILREYFTLTFYRIKMIF
ncbi:MAG: YdcF family protein [Anaerolineaceae bacterium]